MNRSGDTSEEVMSVLLARDDNGWDRMMTVKKVKSRKRGIYYRTTVKQIIDGLDTEHQEKEKSTMTPRFLT